jgi:hypothetical protein
MGFVYCWVNLGFTAGRGRFMLYVGKHAKSQSDGYICSSKMMLEDFIQHPLDFRRFILFEGSVEECTQIESKLLEAENAASNSYFYNQTNGGKNFVCKGHSLGAREKMKGRVWVTKNCENRLVTREKADAMINDGWSTGRYFSSEHRDKISHAISAIYNNGFFGFKGKSHSLESIEKMRVNKIGRGMRDSNGNAKAIIIAGKKYACMRDACDSLNKSYWWCRHYGTFV